MELDDIEPPPWICREIAEIRLIGDLFGRVHTSSTGEYLNSCRETDDRTIFDVMNCRGSLDEPSICTGDSLPRNIRYSFILDPYTSDRPRFGMPLQHGVIETHVNLRSCSLSGIS